MVLHGMMEGCPQCVEYMEWSSGSPGQHYNDVMQYRDKIAFPDRFVPLPCFTLRTVVVLLRPLWFVKVIEVLRRLNSTWLESPESGSHHLELKISEWLGSPTQYSADVDMTSFQGKHSPANAFHDDIDSVQSCVKLLSNFKFWIISIMKVQQHTLYSV